MRSCFTGVEGRVLVLSVSRDKGLSVFELNFCLLVCRACVASGGLATKRDCGGVGASKDTRVIRRDICKG